jgi:hypothetical protein
MSLVVIAIMVTVTVAAAAVALAPLVSEGRLVFATEPDKPHAFGYRMSWLAIRSRDTRRVMDVLGLTHQTIANWRTGLGVVYDRQLGDQRIFVSPPVNGWTFVVGLAIPQPMRGSFIDKWTPLMTRLGHEFIEVQYFATFSSLDFQAWARIVDGKLVRAFAIGDEGVILNVGKPTKEEKTLGLKLFELRGVRGRTGDAGGELILHPTEEHVMKLAARWSVDPTLLDTAAVASEPGTGFVTVAPPVWHAERFRRAA